MRSGLVSTFSLFCIVAFSTCLVLSSNLSFFWLFLELCTLSLVPMFLVFQNRGTLLSLFNYLIVSSVSSSLIVSGVLYESFLFLSVLGFFIKFGIFPFFGWVYLVVLKSNGLVAWSFSTLLKVPFFCFPFFLSTSGLNLGWLYWFFILTFLFLSLFFWVYSYSLLHCWCHMMLSSSVVLLSCSLTLSMDTLLYFYLLYFFWASFALLYLWTRGSSGTRDLGSSFLFVFLLVSFPFTLSLFYKLVTSFCIYSCGLWVFYSWVVYSISEQLFLLSFILGISSPRGNFEGLCAV